MNESNLLYNNSKRDKTKTNKKLESGVCTFLLIAKQPTDISLF